MITGSEMAVVDENAEALGVSRKQLMESSGNAVAQTVREIAQPGDQVTVLAGRGNNGGDAFVAARFLDSFDLTVQLLGREETISTEIARDNWEALQTAEYDTREIRDSTAIELDEPAVIVDGMLGTGISGELREPAATAAARINESEATVVSVDVPSGLDTERGTLPETAVEPDHVVTFHETKPGLDTLGASVSVVDIGIPEMAQTVLERGDLSRLSRQSDSHKGEHGEVLVIGGGPYTGAPALAAQATLRAGADLVRVTCPTSVAHEVQGYSENLILRPMQGREFEPGHVGPVMEFAAEHDALIIGPGLGAEQPVLEAVKAILEAYEGTAVVDADALEVVPGLDTDATLICTPHQGELVTMGGKQVPDWRDRMAYVESFSRELGHTLLVKGEYDVLSDGERTRVNRTGNPGMTVGGTGDVLAGVTGAFAARQQPIHAAGLGAYVTGRAGNLAAREYGHGLVASDLLDRIPAAMDQS